MLCPEITRQRCAVEFTTNVPMTEDLLENFLEDLTGSLGMTIFMGPFIKVGGEYPYDGPSAILGWEESGCQVHCWPRFNFVSIDVYSCKPYKLSDVLNSIEYWFEPEKVEVL